MRLPRLSAARLTLLLAGVALLVQIGTSDVALGSAPVRAGLTERTVAEVQDYWTPERMRDALPLDLGAGSTQSAPRAATSTRPSSSGVAFTSYELTDTRSYPNRVHGKVFFTRPGAGDFVCSGTVVDAANRATVITAGHCVYDAGVWSTNFAFAPGYGKTLMLANSPYGVWPASGEAAPEPWVTERNWKFDVGAVVIARDHSGRSLQSVVGARGIAFNQPISQRFRSHGYPAEPTREQSWDGTRLWACDSSPPITDGSLGGSGPTMMGIGCDMTGGASGGGWVTSGGLVNGVNSWRYTNQPNMMYGPYFGDTIKALYDFAAREAPGTPASRTPGYVTPLVPDTPPAATPPATCKRTKQRKRKRTRKRACKAKRTSKAKRSAQASSAM